MVAEDSSVRPLYQKVKAYIESRIKSGVWQTDTRIPSENALVKTLGVSRMTVNRAVRELTAEGRLMRVQGVGTFVAEAKPQFALLEIKSIAAEIRDWGGVHSSDVNVLKETAVFDIIERAQRSGLHITADRYPYLASFTQLSAALPSWVFEGGKEVFFERIADAGQRERMRSELKATDTLDQFWSLLESTPGLDVQAEIDQLIVDLQAIYDEVSE